MLNILEVDSLQKSYYNKNILSDIYLKCVTGDTIGIFGRNGSGKSTLLQIIFGSLQAENKFIRLNGKLRNKLWFNRDIAYLPQDNFLPQQLTVKKLIKISVNVKYHSELYQDECLKLILGTKIKNLSGGEKRYLEIVHLLYGDALFLLMDEPYKGLAPALVEKINTLIILKSKTKGIIITDHLYESVLKVANKIYYLNKGCLKQLNGKESLIEFGYLNI